MPPSLMGRMILNRGAAPCSTFTARRARIPTGGSSPRTRPAAIGNGSSRARVAYSRRDVSPHLLPARIGRATRAASLSDETVAIVGAGAFATALASVISARGVSAVLYTDDQEVVRD